MKILTKLMTVLLALSMLFALCACGDNAGKSGDNGMANYQVKVLDGQGTPLTGGVIVKFLQNGEEVAMQSLNADGVATKELAKGDYTVQLEFTNSALSGHYDTAAAVLSADKTTLELTLISNLSGEPVTLYVADEEYSAYNVSAGSTYVPIKASARNYFLFSPVEAGTYEFSVSNNDLKLGYYGSPYFVQAQSAIDVIDNTVTVSISASSLGGSTYVIGVDGVDADTECVLSIIRTGDPTITISDMPWTEYKTSHTPSPYTLTLKAGESLKYIDITGSAANNEIVFNAADGYYHYRTADGPVMLVHLGKGAPYVSLQTVIIGDGAAGGAPIREYFYDENGEFVKKEDYTDILSTYFENMDQEKGVYPLNDDLIYIIKNGCNGWWDSTSPDFIFTDCNPEIGWMFALCYVG